MKHDHAHGSRPGWRHLFGLASPTRALEWAIAVFALLVVIPAHAQSPGDPYNYARTSSFTYYGVSDGVLNGLLKSETVEPDNAQSCVVTTYTYDTYGNKAQSSTANCAGATGRAVFAARAASSVYAAAPSQPIVVSGSPVNVAIPAGVFATSAINALNQTETHQYDPRFGVTLKLTGPNYLDTNWVYDDFGRKVKEIRADGTKTVVWYCIFGAGLDPLANSVNDGTPCPMPATGEAPADAVSFTHSEPRDASSTIGIKMGPFVRVYSDRLGRELRSVTESFDGAGQPAGRSAVLIVKDSVYSIYGTKVLQTQPYFLASGSSTVTGSADVGLTRTDYDALGRPTVVYVADASGSQPSVIFPYYGSRQASRQSVAYAGLTTTTNDKNQTRVEEKNADGKVVRVTDATQAQIAYQHDAFGNLLTTKDALQNIVAIAYDIRGRKTSMTDPDTGLWQYDYDALGELVWQQNPTQRAVTPTATQTTMAYDRLGRMTQRVDPEYTSTWSYDQYADASACNKGTGKLCETNTSNGVNRKIVYDGFGRPVNSRTTVTSGPSFASALVYDNVTGRLASQTYPTGLQVGYSYTGRSFLEKLTLLTSATINPLPTTPGGTPGSSSSLASGVPLWTAQVVNAWGKVEQQQYGNGVLTKAAFEAFTGRTTTLTAGVGASTSVLNHQYVWDSLNNLTGRTDNNGDGTHGAVGETFSYGDALNRLTQYAVSNSQINPPSQVRNVTLQYNALGMLLYKSDVGNYVYGTQGAGAVRPHALQSVSGAVTSSYVYDANGNLASSSTGKYRSIAYTSFNLPDSQTGITGPSGSPQYTWQYDENHARIKEVRTVASGTYAGTRTTWDMHPDNHGGLSFESEVNAPTTPSAANPAVTSNRHYLSVSGQVIGVMVSTGALPTLPAGQNYPIPIASITLVKLEYWHKDHLGSLAATTDHTGALTQAYSYDPFGKRRTITGQYDAFGTLVYDWSPAVNYGTDRGYTGHEELDDIGLVHMNGRIYDATLGLFLQGDPFIQDPLNLQNFNRYGYCYNNPMGCTDPSGFCFMGCFWQPKNLHKLWNNKFVRTVVIIVAAYYTGGAALDWYASEVAATAGYAAADAAVAAGMVGSEVTAATVAAESAAYAAAATSVAGGAIAGAASGFTGGFIASDGDLGAALKGAVGGALSGGINGAFGSQYPMSRVVANGVAGGMGSVIRGGKFQDGFASSLAISSLMYLNVQMREAMIEQSKIDPRNDGTGLSRGVNGDGFKLAGGRFNFFSDGGTSPLGGDQVGPGTVFGISYSKGGFADMVLESFAGPHDSANSRWFYDPATGDIKDFSGWNNFEKAALEVTTNYTTSLLFAAPFAATAIIEQTDATSSLLTRKRRRP